MNLLTHTSVLCAFFHVAIGARILCVYPAPSYSHQLVYRALTKELLRRGHRLVVITTDPYKPQNEPNLKEIDVSDSSAAFMKHVANIASKSTSPVGDFHNFVLRGAIEAYEVQVRSPEVQELLHNETERFDLLIVEAVVRCSYFFTHRFRGVPTIGFSSLMGLQYNYEATGTPSDPTLYPDLFQSKVGDLNLWDTAKAIYVDLYQMYSFWSSAQEENRIGKMYFGIDTPDIRELMQNNDLLFLNVNPIWDGVRPIPPNVIYVGGLHINPPQELKKGLKDYLDSCSQGVIYMSLGSQVKSSELPSEKLQSIQRVFSELPYCVLWKWETEDMPNKPSNVKLLKWMPQADILAHPNVLVFISQGGLQSTDEAIDRGVPLVGIPFVSDQEKNVNKYVHHGIGIRVHPSSLTYETLKNAVLAVIKDERYRHNIRKLRSIMKDQPETSMQRAIWWVDYLLRHGTAKHLKAPRSFSAYCYILVLAAGLIVSTLLNFACLVITCKNKKNNSARDTRERRKVD